MTSASGLELSFDERAKAEHLSYLFKTEHYEVVVKAGDMERVLPDVVTHLEDLRVGQSYPNYYVARLASRFSKVTLSGTGSDELFAGYPWRYPSGATQAGTVSDFVERHFAYWQRIAPDGARKQLLSPLGAVDADFAFSRFRQVYSGRLEGASATPEGLVNLCLYFECRTFLHGLLVVEDKLSMAHGLESRVPFLDNELVDFAMAIPARYKLRSLSGGPRVDENVLLEKHAARSNDGKRILRDVLARHVPPHYADAVKQGFSAPDGSWFKGESMDYVRRLLLGPRARLWEYLDRGTGVRLLEDHFAGRANRRLFIWSCLCFEWWLRIFDPEG